MRTSAMVLVCWAAAGSALFDGLAHAGANLLTNGSFEDGPRVGLYLTLAGGSTELPGWTVLGTTIDVVGTGWVSADGARGIDLDGSPGPGGLAQTFATVPGQWYSVSLQMAGNPQCGPTVKSMLVSAAGQATTMSFDVTGKTFQNMGWEERNWCFLADDRQATLSFMSLTGGPTPCGAAIDLVAVEPSGGPSQGDLNCDQLVDGADLGLLLGAWGDCANCISCIADLNDDCEIDGADLGLLLGAWTG